MSIIVLDLRSPAGDHHSRSRLARRTSPATHTDQDGELSDHDIVRRWQGNERMRLGHEVTNPSGRLSFDQDYSATTVRDRSRDPRTVRGAVADRRGRVRNRARMLIRSAPGWFATDQNGGRTR